MKKTKRPPVRTVTEGSYDWMDRMGFGLIIVVIIGLATILTEIVKLIQ